MIGVTISVEMVVTLGGLYFSGITVFQSVSGSQFHRRGIQFCRALRLGPGRLTH